MGRVTRLGDPMTVGLTRLGQTPVLEERPTPCPYALVRSLRVSVESYIDQRDTGLQVAASLQYAELLQEDDRVHTGAFAMHESMRMGSAHCCCAALGQRA